MAGVGVPQDNSLLSPGQSQTLLSQRTVQAGDTLTANSLAVQYYATKYSLPANSVQPGQFFIFKGNGSFTVSTATAPTVVAGLAFGTVQAVATPAVSNPAGSNNLGFTAEVMSEVLTVGSTGTIRSTGILNFGLTGTTGISVILPPTTATVDFTVAQLLQWFAQFSSVVAGNSVGFGNMAFTTGMPLFSA